MALACVTNRKEEVTSTVSLTTTSFRLHYRRRGMAHVYPCVAAV
jgi:hypothetical protein